MSYTKRNDGRKFDQMRKIEAKVNIIPRADGSAMFKIGDTYAIAAVYGPRSLHPKFLQDPEKGVLRCNYTMLPFSVTERIRPGPSRRSTEISLVTQKALLPVLDLEKFPNAVVDVFIQIIQANAGTRCAGICAAAMALAHAGIPMKNLVSSVSIGKLDKQLVVDVSKHEEDWEEGEGATDIPITFTPNGDITHIQLDGKIETKQLKEAIKLAREACKEIYELQKKTLKESIKINEKK